MKIFKKKMNYFSLLVITIFFQFNKINSEYISSSIFDLDFSNVNDDILSKYKDFDFAQDKKDILSTQETKKKVACLYIIKNHIQTSNDELKNKLKEAKSINKNNYKKFIKNITNICIKRIKKHIINKVLNYQNIIDKQININEDILQFNQNFENLLKETERVKKFKEIEIEKNNRNNRIKNLIVIIGIILVCIVVTMIFRNKKDKNLEEKEDKKGKSKKKLKKN